MTSLPILGHLTSLADATRCRMLLLLERQPLTVSQMCSVLQLPQSTVSRHLKTLSESGWVAGHRDGASRLYLLADGVRRDDTWPLWQLVREQVAASASVSQDERRLKDVMAQRRSRSQEFFEQAASDWEHMRTDLFGATFHLQACLGLMDPDWVVGDLGCGTGVITAVLAGWVKSVVAVDVSEPMLVAARARLAGVANVTFERAELESLPIADGQLDACILSLVLHHVDQPAAVLAEARRVLRPGGRLLAVDMFAHDRQEYRHQMGHVWTGFEESQVVSLLQAAGFTRSRVRALVCDPAARGPALFAAVATVPPRSH